jgi:hypothetical protein
VFVSEALPRTHDQDVLYWSRAYEQALAEGEYAKRMMAAAALRELDGIEDREYV